MATHRFTPARYYQTIGAHEPALRVADGDTVITTTVDAWGLDAADQKLAHEPNPMTGPFFVEGAAPGDTLAVHIMTLVPNRSRGWTRRVLAPNVVDPHAVPALPVENEIVHWRVDLNEGAVTLVEPAARLGALSLPLAPMIGCFGVAPAGGESISTATSGPHGGNMDYRGFGAGVTAYFPVSVPGALFYLGDVHARQGHGEIAGTGVEISADVEFTVRVLKGKRIGWPRGEDEHFIFTAGNARPLDQALQHATTEMVRWLEQDYGLDAVSVGLLLGQAVEYEVGNVFDPAYTMICKLPRALLRGYGHA